MEDKVNALDTRVGSLESHVYANGKPGLRETQAAFEDHIRWHRATRNENVMTRNALIGALVCAAASVIAALASLAVTFGGHSGG